MLIVQLSGRTSSESFHSFFFAPRPEPSPSRAEPCILFTTSCRCRGSGGHTRRPTLLNSCYVRPAPELRSSQAHPRGSLIFTNSCRYRGSWGHLRCPVPTHPPPPPASFATRNCGSFPPSRPKFQNTIATYFSYPFSFLSFNSYSSFLYIV